MKKKGDMCKRFEGLDKILLKIVGKEEMTTPEIFNKLDLKITSKTLLKYLHRLEERKKVKSKSFCKLILWKKA